MRPMRQCGVILGGPSYQMSLDARHAGSMIGLALHFAAREWRIMVNYRHGCPVEIPRNGLFESALRSDFDVLVWSDSDCYWPDWAAPEIVWLAIEIDRLAIPFCSIPVLQRDGTPNIVTHKNGPRWERFYGSIAVERKLHPCYASGLGFAVFNLAWYRRNWDRSPWFRTDWREGEGFVSEDFWHTENLSLLGSGPRFAPLFPITHAGRGSTDGAQTPVAKP